MIVLPVWKGSCCNGGPLLLWGGGHSPMRLTASGAGAGEMRCQWRAEASIAGSPWGCPPGEGDPIVLPHLTGILPCGGTPSRAPAQWL